MDKKEKKEIKKSLDISQMFLRFCEESEQLYRDLCDIGGEALNKIEQIFDNGNASEKSMAKYCLMALTAKDSLREVMYNLLKKRNRTDIIKLLGLEPEPERVTIAVGLNQNGFEAVGSLEPLVNNPEIEVKIFKNEKRDFILEVTFKKTDAYSLVRSLTLDSLCKTVEIKELKENENKNKDRYIELLEKKS